VLVQTVFTFDLNKIQWAFAHAHPMVKLNKSILKTVMFSITNVTIIRHIIELGYARKHGYKVCQKTLETEALAREFGFTLHLINGMKSVD
jgi:hypothetical protein